MHDKNRGEGSFEKAVEAVDLAVKRRITTWTITTLTRNNIEGIDYIVELARKMRFGATFQFLHHNSNFGRNHAALMPEHKQCVEASKKMLDYKHKGYPIVSSKKYLKMLLNWPDFHRSVLMHSIDGIRCVAGQYYCIIDTDGIVYPCSMAMADKGGIDTLKVGFDKAFYSLNRPNCQTCLSSCMREHSYMFRPTISHIIDNLRYIKR
jgi:MoaA/NifB/PqqE/SkfB family radical SAM enzyme